jgi:hypothetical protein
MQKAFFCGLYTDVTEGCDNGKTPWTQRSLKMGTVIREFEEQRAEWQRRLDALRQGLSGTHGRGPIIMTDQPMLWPDCVATEIRHVEAHLAEVDRTLQVLRQKM